MHLGEAPQLQLADRSAGGIEALPQIIGNLSPCCGQLFGLGVAGIFAEQFPHDVLEPRFNLLATSTEVPEERALSELVKRFLHLSVRLPEDGQTLVFDVLELGLPVVLKEVD